MELADAILGFLILMSIIGILVFLYATVKELKKADRFDIW
jgi:hypothetical protein